MAVLNARGFLVAGILAGIGASMCCVGPLVLLTLGIGGAWIGYLSDLEPYRPLFIGLALVFFGLAFRKLYRLPQECAPGTPCQDPRTNRRQRLTLWVVAIAVVGLVAVPWFAPLFH